MGLISWLRKTFGRKKKKEIWERVKREYVPEECPDQEKCRATGCTMLDSEEKYICVYPRDSEQIEERKKAIRQWNEAIKIIPQKDQYALEGIKCWRVFDFDLEMLPDTWDDEFTDSLFREEAQRLVDAGFKLGFNDDHGVGDIIKEKDGTFTIRLSQYRHESWPLEHVSLNKALDWVLDFYGVYESLKPIVIHISSKEGQPYISYHRIDADDYEEALSKLKVVMDLEVRLLLPHCLIETPPFEGEAKEVVMKTIHILSEFATVEIEDNTEGE